MNVSIAVSISKQKSRDTLDGRPRSAWISRHIRTKCVGRDRGSIRPAWYPQMAPSIEARQGQPLWRQRWWCT